LIWKQEVLAMVAGLNLSHFLEGNTVTNQNVYDESAQTNLVNPEFLRYNQQDQLIRVASFFYD